MAPPKRPTASMLAGENEELKQRLKEIEDELEQAKSNEQRLRKYKKYYKEAKALNSGRESTKNVIHRPAGERGKDGWILIEKMKLKDNKELYCEIMRGVRLLIAQAGLDASLRISRQEPGRIHQIITAARTQWPYLRKFEGGWPVREFIQSTLRNRRYRDKQRKKTVVRKAKNRRNELQRARTDDMEVDGGENDGQDDPMAGSDDEAFD